MIEPDTGRESKDQDNEFSVLAMLSLLLKWRRPIIVLGFIGGGIGLASGLLSTRMYISSATFIPQGSDASVSSIALAASQLGVRVPASGNQWGPPIYVELLRARALLKPIALDTLAVAEENGRKMSVMEIVQVEDPIPERRLELTVRALSDIITATEDKKLGAVRLDVTTPWPSVSLGLANLLIRGVNDFNLKTRQSQASSERQFAESQAAEAEVAVRRAEDRLQAHVQRNRTIANSPELVLERDRLQREVLMRQQLYSSIMLSLEEAKIREVRNTPVITILQAPELPTVGKARKSAKKAVLGGMIGGVLAILIAFSTRGLAAAQREPSEDVLELQQVLSDATPKFLLRMLRSRTVSTISPPSGNA